MSLFVRIPATVHPVGFGSHVEEIPQPEELFQAISESKRDVAICAMWRYVNSYNLVP
jgi:hypothetical protein